MIDQLDSRKVIKTTVVMVKKTLEINPIVSSVRSSNSHPDLLVTHQHQQHPTFSDNKLVLENSTF